MALEHRDAILAHALALLGIEHTLAVFGGQAQHAELALVLVVMDLVGGLAAYWFVDRSVQVVF